MLLVPFGARLELTTRVPPDSQAFRLSLNHNMDFHGSPACRQLMVGLLGLHNMGANAYNEYLMCICIHPIDSVSLENLIHCHFPHGATSWTGPSHFSPWAGGWASR